MPCNAARYRCLLTFPPPAVHPEVDPSITARIKNAIIQAAIRQISFT
jgi:hypothetical protein